MSRGEVTGNDLRLKAPPTTTTPVYLDSATVFRGYSGAHSYYYAPTHSGFGTAAEVALTANTGWLTRFRVPEYTTISTVYFCVTSTGSAGSQTNVAIYDGDVPSPLTRLAVGTQSALGINSTGWKGQSLNSSLALVPEKTYYAAFGVAGDGTGKIAMVTYSSALASLVDPAALAEEPTLIGSDTTYPFATTTAALVTSTNTPILVLAS